MLAREVERNPAESEVKGFTEKRMFSERESGQLGKMLLRDWETGWQRIYSHGNHW